MERPSPPTPCRAGASPPPPTKVVALLRARLSRPLGAARRRRLTWFPGACVSRSVPLGPHVVTGWAGLGGGHGREDRLLHKFVSFWGGVGGGGALSPRVLLRRWAEGNAARGRCASLVGDAPRTVGRGPTTRGGRQRRRGGEAARREGEAAGAGAGVAARPRVAATRSPRPLRWAKWRCAPPTSGAQASESRRAFRGPTLAP